MFCLSWLPKQFSSVVTQLLDGLRATVSYSGLREEDVLKDLHVTFGVSQCNNYVKTATITVIFEKIVSPV